MSWDNVGKENLSHAYQKEPVRSETSRKKKVLLFSYAFPPMQVQMTPAVIKPMAAIASLGYEVDVLCADSFSPHLPLDTSLVSYAEKVFPRVHRLNPPKGFRGRIQRRSRVLSCIPDLMTVLHQSAYEYLMDVDLTRYEAVMTWSPFHSINPVMVRVKKQRKNVRWIAQFSDPWAGNPLEVNRLAKLWNSFHEPRTVAAADFIVHSSAYSLDLMLKEGRCRYRNKAMVLPHVYNDELYPDRRKADNECITMRYVGVLYGRRTPEPLFAALNALFARRKELQGKIRVELIGLTPPEMLSTPEARALPEGTVLTIPSVNYLRSLELMYDADVLLLIEANVRQNLFLPSKLTDYLGANRPIVGLVPPGGSEDAMIGLKGWYARPADINGISIALERAIEHLRIGRQSEWCDDSFRQSFNGVRVAQQFINIINKL